MRKISYAIRSGIFVTALGWATVLAPAQTAPDNTKMNKGDASRSAVTADKQAMNKEDTALTRKIRKALVADKSLSTYAHNVKIVTQNGMVTLKGPVRSDDEKKSVMAKATDAAGSKDKVTDELSVAPGSK